ncbi:MAG: Fe(3+) ABC transporter substrate-binding protein [Rhodobacteraceae bacterium]|nr:Fe(3+) ABC transporter substrate-binding protein [Paracoccaceae bacterium]
MLTRLHLALSALLLATAAMPVFAQEVNVYSYRQPELVEPLFNAFTAETGIAVNSVFLSKGLVERLKSEGDRSPADLVLTTDISRLAELVAEGVTQPVESAALDAAIPAIYRDPAHHWFGLTSRARVIYAANDRVADGDVTTYEDLASDKWKGRICTRSGTNAYNVALTAAMIAHHGEEDTAHWLEAVKANLARKPQGNDRAQVKAIWAGECDIAVGNTYYMGLMLKDPEQKAWADSVRIIFPTFEDGGTHVNVSGVAMTKAAPNRDNAVKLMEFLASHTGQELYAEINDEYPVDPSVPASALVTSWGSFTPDALNLMDIAHMRPAALRLTETVDFDG